MNTQLHAWYLGALGVVRYIPRGQPVTDEETRDVVDSAGADPELSPAEMRKPLADAPEARIKADAVTDAVTNPETNPVTKATASRSAIATHPDIKKSATPQPSQSGQDRISDEENIQFRLAFWQPSAEMIVLSAMPPGIRPGQPQQEMLSKLLAAIHQLPAALPQVELLDWPLSPGADRTLRGAREMVNAFLDVKHYLQPFRRVLLMGSVSAKLVSALEAPSVGERIDVGGRAEGIITHSLYEMDQDKTLKRETWEALRFLAGDGG